MNMSMAKFDNIRIQSANPKLAKRYFKLKCFFQLAIKFSWFDFLYNIDIVL